jgi:hypothetical protein
VPVIVDVDIDDSEYELEHDLAKEIQEALC